tara:strand:+ start:611 stop:1699 length:1089 start_codon:yes stop_codon:yes gene_type:complete
MNKKITILFPFSGDSFGGGHVSIINMIKKLNKKHFKPIVWLHKDGKVKNILVKENIEFVIDTSLEVFESNSLFNFFVYSLNNFFKVKQILSKYSIDIVHTNDAIMQAVWNLPVFLCKKKFVWHMRSKDNSRRLIIYSFFADRILAVSDFCKKNLPLPFCNKIKVIKNFFRVPKLYPRPNTNFFNISYVANYKAQKQPELFFSIINQTLVLKKEININFYIYGSLKLSQKKNLLNKVSLKKHHKHVYFKGHKFPIDPWLNRSHISVSLGINEGFGRVIIESMLNKTLVLAIKGGGHDEIIINKKNGILIDSSDPKVFAKKLIYLLENSKLSKQLINKAYKFAKKKYIDDNNIEVISNIYKELV